MKSKVLVFTVAAVLTVGIGAAAAYTVNADTVSHGEMHYHMKEMHANESETHIEHMYNSCHQNAEYTHMQGMMRHHSVTY